MGWVVLGGLQRGGEPDAGNADHRRQRAVDEYGRECLVSVVPWHRAVIGFDGMFAFGVHGASPMLTVKTYVAYIATRVDTVNICFHCLHVAGFED